MPVPPIIQRIFTSLADAIDDRRPCPTPDPGRLRDCRIISHRGSHDNRRIIENTLTAFDQAAGAGVWGIELDIRWTRDLEPVVYHDMDLTRLHGSNTPVAALTLNQIERDWPAIPSLAEVVCRYGRRLHLMIEIKRQPWPAPRLQEQQLMRVLSPLEPIRDYHLLTLDPGVLQPFAHIQPRVCVAIADGWPGFSSRWVRRHHWGGICGHYLLVGQTMVRRHHRQHQQVGTGYVKSGPRLARELNRGIDWIFSNHAVALQKKLKLLEQRLNETPGKLALIGGGAG